MSKMCKPWWTWFTSTFMLSFYSWLIHIIFINLDLIIFCSSLCWAIQIIHNAYLVAINHWFLVTLLSLFVCHWILKGTGHESQLIVYISLFLFPFNDFNIIITHEGQHVQHVLPSIGPSSCSSEWCYRCCQICRFIVSLLCFYGIYMYY